VEYNELQHSYVAAIQNVDLTRGGGGDGLVSTALASLIKKMTTHLPFECKTPLIRTGY